jgi:CRP-like cAMP-binding protein
MENIEVFKKIPLFSDLTSTELIKVSNLTQKVTFNTGDNVFKQGDAGDALYLIRSGEVEVLVTKGIPDEGDEVEMMSVAVLGPGDLFGEMALVEKELRSATIRAKSETKLLRIKENYFQELMSNDSIIALKIYKRLTTILSHRVRDTTERLTIANSIIHLTSQK